jgi:hypothetical protein
MSKSIGDLISRVKTLPDLPAGASVLLDEVARQATDLLAHQQTLESDLVKAKEARDKAEAAAPKDGQVLVSKEDADKLERLSAYEALGPAEEVKTRLDRATELERENGSYKRRDTVAEAVQKTNEALGRSFRTDAIIDHLPEGATLEPFETTRLGKKVTIYRVREGDTAKPLDEWVNDFKSKKSYVEFETQERRATPQPGRSNNEKPTQDEAMQERQAQYQL